MEMAARKKSGSSEERERAIERIENNYSAQTLLLANRLENATNLDTHITILGGSLVRGGGTPTAADRLLATQLAEWSLKMVDGWQFWSDGLPSGWRDEQRAPGSGSWQKQAGTDGSRWLRGAFRWAPVWVLAARS